MPVKDDLAFAMTTNEDLSKAMSPSVAMVSDSALLASEKNTEHDHSEEVEKKISATVNADHTEQTSKGVDTTSSLPEHTDPIWFSTAEVPNDGDVSEISAASATCVRSLPDHLLQAKQKLADANLDGKPPARRATAKDPPAFHAKEQRTHFHL
jgi:hypothetical protein